ncbi:uncharacterized protein LOC110996049 [Pieris rapae]|uniref:uncharacterized protein LOC110996049 n=1 Tax=Pieris rapae TaxID=64459 RepID=UPI001E27BA6C|nr:uncharacterized protein LOC110996049 [Pieris rapae]
MTENKCLPLLLISTSDFNCVEKFLADLVEENQPAKGIATNESRVWRIQNKYYRAQVHLLVWPDGVPSPPHIGGRFEAHVIYLRADEGEEEAERRATAADAVGGRPHVRLAVFEGPETDGLVAWGLRRRFELVPMTPNPESDDECGADRARAALHAHMWPGLERVDALATYRPPDSLSGSGDEDEGEEAWGEWEAWEVVGAAREGRGALGAEPDAERRLRAETLLQAFLATFRPRAP